MNPKPTSHQSRSANFTAPFVLWVALSLTACVAALPIILQIGASMLQVCLENYGHEKKSLLESLLLALSSSVGFPPSDEGPEPVLLEDPEAKSSESASSEGGGLRPIGFDVALLKRTVVQATPQLAPMKDGDTLKDGRGDPQAGDKFRILFRADTDCYVYVVAIDATAWAQGLFPSVDGSLANPVAKGQTYALPQGRNWYSLDQYRGIQHIYFVASHQRRPDIEEILSTITGLERDPGDAPKPVRKPVVLPDGYGRTGPSQVPLSTVTSRGQTEHVEAKTYFAKAAGEALRVTRWFRHQ